MVWLRGFKVKCDSGPAGRNPRRQDPGIGNIGAGMLRQAGAFEIKGYAVVEPAPRADLLRVLRITNGICPGHPFSAASPCP